MTNWHVLFVDDEPNVLKAFRRNLHGAYPMAFAESADAALGVLGERQDIAVVVSDMRMPGKSGAELLGEVSRKWPDLTRIMLTGNNDQATAVQAVNEGRVFRFLNKPCEVAELKSVLEDALRQYQLVTAEREVLEETLNGSVKVMGEILAIAKPEVFGAATRIAQISGDIASEMGGVEKWKLQAAATLSQLGHLKLSDWILEKINRRETLSGDEEAEYDELATFAASLIEKIPRLDAVAEIIRDHKKPWEETELLESHILAVASEFDRLVANDWSPAAAVTELSKDKARFSRQALEALQQLIAAGGKSEKKLRLAVEDLTDVMVIAEDIRTEDGILLICKGQAVTPAVRQHLEKFQRAGSLAGQPLVTVPQDSQAA